jgi:hypothetical protein
LTCRSAFALASPAFVGVLARQVAADNLTINNLLPGRFDTDRPRENLEFATGQARRFVI